MLFNRILILFISFLVFFVTNTISKEKEETPPITHNTIHPLDTIDGYGIIKNGMIALSPSTEECFRDKNHWELSYIYIDGNQKELNEFHYDIRCLYNIEYINLCNINLDEIYIRNRELKIVLNQREAYETINASKDLYDKDKYTYTGSYAVEIVIPQDKKWEGSNIDYFYAAKDLDHALQIRKRIEDYKKGTGGWFFPLNMLVD